MEATLQRGGGCVSLWLLLMISCQRLDNSQTKNLIKFQMMRRVTVELVDVAVLITAIMITVVMVMEL